MTEVLLLNMPFVSLARPAIGISLLKARMREEGLDCSIGYGSIFFAEYIGLPLYEVFLSQISPAMFAGDWLFSQWLYPERDPASYLATLRHHLSDRGDADYENIVALLGRLPAFLDACLEKFEIARFDLIGFTSTFEQNLASLALAKAIKNRHPEKKIVFGGANCEGVMGLEMHRRFPWIDYICSGESDNSFPLLVKQIDRANGLDAIPGLIYRDAAGETKLAAPADRIHDMDCLPDPDYDDYFTALHASSLAQQITPSLLIESARGCWWGAKAHCTFCGLNGATMAFRAKSATRVLGELERQKARYGVTHFLAVDNIMSYNYFRDLLPMLKERNPGVTLFYEIKSNLRREQVELLRDAGVIALQPGIESLNSHVLKLMRKGVTGIQNIQLLRFCREYGIEIAWNLLYGFPGETSEDYAATGAVIDFITHLKPPGVAAPIRLDRFSPNYDQAESFGIAEIRPFAMYELIYDLPRESVSNLAYFFEYKYADGRQPKSYVTPVLEKVEEWRSRNTGDLIKRYGLDPELVVEDTRIPGQSHYYPFRGIEREVYEFCDEIQNDAGIGDFAAARGQTVEWTASFLDRMLHGRLMLREGNQYLSLAVDCNRRTSRGRREDTPSIAH